MRIMVDIPEEQLDMVDDMIDYYEQQSPKQTVRRDTIISACISKVWHDRNTKEV